MSTDDQAPARDDEPSEATLAFHEQADGRKVARLYGGKVVLVRWDDLDRVKDGEHWNVKLVHKETYAIATLVERARQELINPVLSSSLGALLARSTGAAATTPPPQPSPPAQAPPTPAVTKPNGRGARQPAASDPPIPSGHAAATSGRPESRQPIPPSRVVGMNDRVAMFVDGANMDLASRLAGYFVDYRKARNFFLAHGLFYAAYYYIADYTAQDSLQQRYLDFLAHADYIVRRKAVKAIRDQETGERVLKANVDTELILDLVNTADNYDLAFLFSGDSDFERAVDLLRSRGKRVYVVTSRQVISRELAYVADKPVFFLEEFRAQLERDARPENGPAS